MPRTVFVYEFLTAGGLLGLPSQPVPEGSLLAEGTAMALALAEDVAKIPGTQLVMACDSRLPSFAFSLSDVIGDNGKLQRVRTSEEHDRAITQLAAAADATFVIAPELDGQLLRIRDMVTAAGGTVIGPSREVVILASDKNRTAAQLLCHGLPTPQGMPFRDDWRSLRFPVVVKRVDGAGSESIRLCDSPAAVEDFVSSLAGKSIACRIETFCHGTPVSVALRRGSAGFVTLPTCRQNLSDDGRFTYLGSTVLADESTEVFRRSQRLAARVAESVLAGNDAGRGNFGYVGIDMVIDESTDEDWVIEINPRLTTSYVGLRHMVEDNLAARMIGQGDGPIRCATAQDAVRWLPDGRVWVNDQLQDD